MKVTLIEASAYLISNVYMSEPNEQLLIENNLENVGVVTEQEYEAGTEFTFYIETLGELWDLGTYKHYSDSEFAVIEELSDNKWKIGFEDLPEEEADWDYNDVVLLVELYEE